MTGDDGWRTRLVLGGARSGKSRHAQVLAETVAGPRVFIATAQAFDAEMAERIAHHRADRGPEWRTVEAPVALPEAIATAGGAMVLVDCLTLWTSNLLLSDADVEAATDALVGALAGAGGRIVLVSNEVGWGIVPDNALARRFRDVAGRVNQRVAATVDRVDLVVAGLAMRLK
ncbi:bifunctional adenosylcobinamide kinase/adenosylcobinamide-phosphate guanylyltransferase [Sphingomonas endophytica]|uniref:Bifunctional adenosylcobalamin biosynthesis protein n=1 Tax=Sphingomonas endophytica TaxID=869719 RepID=A0A147I5Q7_9SPHN|nr:bifunctional adenosylcobinamide kinase/adenosylcobinamide-phosphate guanylyltransferase [Sphingomonas endophytica]KTT73862.1 cobalamin biosynthesis protein [Sphingomonas endophytica]